MANRMKAAVCHAFGKPLMIEEVPIPKPQPHQILIKVEACGVCHTDLHAISGDWPVKPKLPFIPGHEGAGVVAALGSEVTFLKEGDRVGVPWLHSDLWTLRLLPVGLGNALQRATEHRLLGQRRFRRVRDR